MEAGNISCDAGGIFLTMRADSTLFYLHVLSTFLQPLAKFSRCFQTRDIDIVSAPQSAKAVIAVLQDTDMQDLFESSQKVLTSVRNGSVRMDQDTQLDRAKQVAVANKFKRAIINNTLTRFSDEICHLSELQTILLQRPTEPQLLHIAKIVDVNEWRFIQRLPIPPSPGNTSDTWQCSYACNSSNSGRSCYLA